MKKRFTDIKGKSMIALVTFIAVLFYSFSGSFTARSQVVNGFLSDESAIQSDLSDESAGEVSRLTAAQILGYLKQIDTNQGRADFESYLNQKLNEKDRLIDVQQAIADQISRAYRFEALLSSLSYPELPMPEVLTDMSSLTISDLVSRLHEEIRIGDLFFNQSRPVSEVFSNLENHSVLNELLRLEQKFTLLNDLISMIEKSGVEADPLLAELRLDKRLTEFWISYSATGNALLDELRLIAELDLSFLVDKILTEQSILTLIEALYPVESGLSEPLGELARDVMLLYSYENSEAVILTLNSVFAYADLVISLLSQEWLNDPTVNLTFELQQLNELAALVFSEGGSKEEVAFMADRLYEYFSDKNSFMLASYEAFSPHYEALKNFNALILLIDPMEQEAERLKLADSFVLEQDLERQLKRQLNLELEIIEMPEAPAAAPAKEEEVKEETPAEEQEMTDDGTEADAALIEESEEIVISQEDADEEALQESAPEEPTEEDELTDFFIAGQDIPILVPIVEFIEDLIDEQVDVLTVEEDGVLKPAPEEDFATDLSKPVAEKGKTPKPKKEAKDTESEDIVSETIEFEPEPESLSLIAKYKVKPIQSHKDEITIKHRGKIKKEFKHFNLLALSLPADELASFELSSDLEAVGSDFQVRTLLDTSREAIQVDSAALKYAVSGEGVKVAVIDTGIDQTHPALVGKVVAEIDITGEGPDDVFGHGTHVSCIIACSDEVYSGVAPGVDLFDAKVIHSNGFASASEIIAALDWALDQGVDIANISLGGAVDNCGDDFLSQAVNMATDLGLLVVVAAGNAGPDSSTVLSPGCAEKALTVGASNEAVSIPDFSSRGPTFDGRVKPDIVAPGVGITAAFLNGSFARLSGTSMATPHLSGLSALMLEAVSDLSASEIKAGLMDNAKDLGFDANTQGSGLAQALAVMEAISSSEEEGEPEFDKEAKQAEKSIDVAEKAIARAEEKIARKEAKGDAFSSAQQILDQAKTLLEESQAAFEAEEFDSAVTLADASKKLANQAGGKDLGKPVEDPVEDPVGDPVGDLIEEPVEEPVEEVYELELINLFEPPPDVFEQELLIRQLIEADEDIVAIQETIVRYLTFEKYALITKDLFNSIIASIIELTAFMERLDTFGLSIDGLDELVSFLNQFTVEMGYQLGVSGFNGVNGVVRIGPAECPAVLAWQLIQPLDERLDFEALRVDEQRSLLLAERDREQDLQYSHLKRLRSLDLNFCVSESTDISTRNLIGTTDFIKQVADVHLVHQPELTVRFENTADRPISFSLLSRTGASEDRLVRLTHRSEDNAPAVALVSEAAAFGPVFDPASASSARRRDETQIRRESSGPEREETIKDALEDAALEIVAIEDGDNLSEAAGEIVSASQYTMSVLEDPERLFSSLEVGNNEILKEIVIFESRDHRRNVINLLTADPHLIVSKRLDEYFIYNYGDGFETESLVFENAVLHLNNNGDIEGFYFSPGQILNEFVLPDASSEFSEDAFNTFIEDVASELHRGGGDLPDFVLSRPVALDRESQLLEGLSYEITGPLFNELVVNFNASVDRYPVSLNVGMVFTNTDQSRFDRELASASLNDLGRFGFSQAAADFDGDSVDDLAVSSFSSDVHRGKVELFLSSDDSGRDTGFVIEGTPFRYFGYSLATADLNQDGFVDLAVGSPYPDRNRGQVWIFYGPFEPSQTVTFSSSADVIITGAGAEDLFGAVLLTGDFNNDGLADLAVSAPNERDGQGSVFLFYSDPEAGISVFGSAPDASVELVGETLGQGRFGLAMTKGDLDSDGRDDLIISAPGLADGAGAVYGFLQNSVPWTKDDDGCDRKCLSASADLMIKGSVSGAQFGQSVALGDFDQNGLNDLAVGVSRFGSPSGFSDGRVHLFHQEAGWWEPSDLPVPSLPQDRQGGEIGEESTTLPVKADDADLVIYGSSREGFGLSLMTVDFNNDSIDDLAVQASGCGFGDGCVYVFESDPEAEEFNVALPGAMSSYDHHDYGWQGTHLSRFGYGLASGDLNGDGIPDLAIGAPQYSDFAGRSYVFSGKQKVVLRPAAAEPSGLTALQPIVEPIEGLAEEPVEGLIEEPAEEEPEFELSPEEIEEALKSVADEEDWEAFVLDITVPENPVIICAGVSEGVFSTQEIVPCSWTDTAGPSEGTYRFCIDYENSCEPDGLSSDRTVQINLTESHTYLRVQTSDGGGTSEIVSFDLAYNNPPVFVSGPSDGGSDVTDPTQEGDDVRFTATAVDRQEDDYTLLVCRTGDLPVYPEGKPQCLGIEENQLCISSVTTDNTQATCLFDTAEESADSLIWYAFVCDMVNGGGNCSESSQGQGVNGSPLHIIHPARFGQLVVTDDSGGLIEAGDKLRFTFPVAELSDVPEDSEVNLFVCSGDTIGFDYELDRCEGGRLICTSGSVSLGQPEVFCVETGDLLTVPVPSKPGTMNYLVFVEYGSKGVIDGIHKQRFVIENTRPRLVEYTNEGVINILGGGSSEVGFSVILEDDNGASDISFAEGIFFDDDTVFNTCKPDRNDCYIDPDCSLTVLDGLRVKAECLVEVFYNANASLYWKVHVNPVDSDGPYSKLGDSETERAVPPLSAINQAEIPIPYAVTLPGTVSEAVSTMLTNLGNQVVDVLISGTDLAGAKNVIPRENQQWSLDSEFDFETEGYELVENPVPGAGPENGCADLTLPVHSDPLQEVSDVMVYWKVLIPDFQKADSYSGNVSFQQTSDNCQ